MAHPSVPLPDSSESQLVVSLPELERLQQESGLGQFYYGWRQTAWQRLAAFTWPSPQEELWRHTPPQPFAFDRMLKASDCRLELKKLPESEAGGLPEGVQLLHKRQDLQKYERVFRKIFESPALESNGNKLLDLHTALSRNIFLLVVQKGRQITSPLCLEYHVPRMTAEQAALPLVVVLLESGSRVTLVERIRADLPGLIFPRLEIVLDDNSSLELLSLQELGMKASYFSQHNFHVGRDVNFRSFHIQVGAAYARLDLDCRFLEPGSGGELYSLYLANGGRHVDYHPIQQHLAPHCQSKLLSKGVISDQARSVYYGLIRVAEGAQKTDAYQANRNLLLSSQARADSIPNLEIQANDVRCSHGSSVGQLGTEELFYLMSRGLRREAAEELLMEGFFEEILAKISDEMLHNLVREVLTRNG